MATVSPGKEDQDALADIDSVSKADLVDVVEPDIAHANENIPRDVISPPSRPRSLILDAPVSGGGGGAGGGGLYEHDDKKEAADDLDTFGSTDLPEHLVSPGSAASSSLYSPQCQTLKGEFSKDGDLVLFTADNLQEQIRRSSPLDRKGDLASSFARSRASSMQSLRSSAVSSCASSRSPSICGGGHPGVTLPPIDPWALLDLEGQSRILAQNVNGMLTKLNDHVKEMSAVTAECVDLYKNGVDTTCDAVDLSIKSMYAFMAKSEELNNQMRPMHQTAHKIKEIKRLLDIFETQTNKMLVNNK